MGAYSAASLALIAAKIGPCIEGRSQREMLECIERAALDYRADQDIPPATSAAVRDQLHALARAAAETGRLLDGLDIGADVRLAHAGLDRGFAFRPDYLADLAATSAAAAAAAGALVRAGPDAALDRFITALSRIVAHFAGWKAAYTVRVDYRYTSDDVIEEAHYTGRFLEVVKACCEPIGIKKSDGAFAKAIHRAFGRDRLST